MIVKHLTANSCLVTKTSMLTGVTREVELPVSADRVNEWALGGDLIQRAFPDLDKAQREFLMTGSTQEEWDKFMGPDE